MNRSVAFAFASVLGLSFALTACGSEDESVPSADAGVEDHDADHHNEADGGDGRAEDADVTDPGDAGVDGGADGAAAGDAGAGAEEAGSADPNAPPALNGCTSYVDRTASGADRTLIWDYGIASDPARCIKVLVGQSVSLQGDLSEHPIDQLGGASPNPFAGANDSKSTFTFTRAGGFGFYCILHMEMNGTVWVVEK